MKFKRWKGSLNVEREYRKSLEVLCDIFDKIAKSSEGKTDLYVRRMQNFQNSVQYERYIEAIIKRMITPISVSNQRTWREAAKKATKGKFLYELLQTEREQNLELAIQSQLIENASLIRTLPNDVALKVVKTVLEEQEKGKRATTIEQSILKYTSQYSRASARLIARTEVSKAQTALTKARCENLDIKWYIWRTAMDGDRVRKSHRNMEDVLVSWTNPPSPEALVGEKDVGNYHAGNIYNCRCYPEPLLEIDDVTWPHKVYHNGVITTMSRRQFEELL